MFKIIDEQLNRYKAGGEKFENKEKVCRHLINYHKIDTNIEAERELLENGEVEKCWNALRTFGWSLEKTD